MGEAKLCPVCNRGHLTYPVDIERGHCLACHLRANGWLGTRPFKMDTYRTEADAYGEGIYDDD